MRLDNELLALASQQHSVVATEQAYAIGLTEDAIRHRLRQGRWQRMSRRVMRLVGSAATDEQALMAALLDRGPGSLIARGTALSLWGVPGFELRPIEVLTDRASNRQRSELAVHHSTNDLLPTHVAQIGPLRVATPIRAIFDIAGVAHPKRVERALDNAWSRRLVTHALLHRTLDELADRGRDGIALMRELASARPRSYRPPESNTEARLNDLLEQAGHRRLVPQRDIGNEEAWIGRIDMGDPDAPNLVIEIQSELFHGSLLDRQRDQVRRDQMRRANFVLVEIWESMIWRHPAEAVALVVDGRRQAREALAA